MGTVNIDAGLAIGLNGDDEGTTAVGIRRALAGLFVQETPGVVSPGRMAANAFVVTGKGNMSYDVTGGGAVLTRSSQGAYLVGSHQTVNVTTTVADSTNPRIDIIYLHQPDPAIDGAGVDVNAVIGVASGTAAASPSPPSIPAGALELSRKVIAANATTTAGGAAFTNIAPVVRLNPVDAASIGTTQGTTVQSQLNSLASAITALQTATDDTGWVGAGFGSAASGWATASFVRRVGERVEFRLRLTRTATTKITANSAGNIADTVVFQLAAGWRPSGKNFNFPYHVASVADGMANIDGNGVISLVTLSPTATIDKNDTVWLDGSFFRG